MKRNVLIGMLAASLVVVGCAVVKCNESVTPDQQSAQAVAKWQKQNPQLFSNVGYIQQLEESAPKLAQLPESLEELRGVSTNPFGIRDDILQYIFTNIPESNESATKAAIKFMQYAQEIYYGNLSESEIMLVHQREGLAIGCLMDYTNDIQPPFKIAKVLRNTKSRDEHMWAIERRYFSWKVLATGLTVSEEKAACEKGEF